MNQIRRCFLALIFLQCCPWPGTAQLMELPNIELISEKDGLPYNSNTCMVQDKLGFIWISSLDGLARYDGYSFVTLQHKPEETNSLPNNSIICLELDKEGMIWAGHIDGFVSRVDPLTFKTTRIQIDDAHEFAVNKIFCDSKGIIWASIDRKGIYKFDGRSTFNFVCPLPNLPQHAPAPANSYNAVREFYEDSNYTFWLGTGNGLYRFFPNDSKLEHVTSLGEKNNPGVIYRIIPDEEGLWCATYGTGFIHYNIKQRDYKSYLFEKGYKGTNNIIYGAARKNDHEIYIASSASGIGVFETTTKKFTFLMANLNLDNSPAISYLMRDRSGIIWAISDKGLHKWDVNENNFLFYRLNVTRSDNHSFYGISCFLKDTLSKRTIIGTTYADGLHVFDKDENQKVLSFPIKAQLEPYLIVNDIFQDKSGNIYVITRDFLFRLTQDNQLIRVEGIDEVLPPSSLPFYYKMLQSDNGDLWVASSRNGLLHLNSKGKKWEHLPTPSPYSLTANKILRILEDRQHRIWLMNTLAGVSIYDPSKKEWTTYKHEPGKATSLPSSLVTDMTITPAGEIFISSLEGISKFNSHSNLFENHNTTTELPSKMIHTMASDDEGVLWAATNKGILRVDPTSWSSTEYTYKDGVKGIYSSFIVQQAGKGKMYAATIQGLYFFEPSKIKNNRKRQAPLTITSLRNLSSNKIEYNPSNRFLVDYQNNSLSIEFAALNFFSPLRNKYRYRMEGLDNEWIETTEHSVNYSAIPSGNYTFRVQLIGDDSNAIQNSIKISVSTPFWKQDWFQMLLATIGLGSVYFFYRIRLNQVRKEEKIKREYNKKLAEVEMKALKAQMNPHFIFNSLNSINRYIVKSEPEKASLYLTKFSKLIRLILDNSNHKIISLENELNALKLYIELEALRFNEKFTYDIHLNEELNPLSVGVPPMIIQPFVENAIWHGLLHKEGSGKLEIAVERYGSGLKCIITDNGVGRKMAGDLKSKSINNAKSYGMKITNDRLTMLNGESKISTVEIVDLEDNEGNALGTKVIVKILSAELEPEF